MADSLQVVDGDGAFNEIGLVEYVKRCGIEGAGVDYSVVAVTGSQSGGKSTLMNALASLCRVGQMGR